MRALAHLAGQHPALGIAGYGQSSMREQQLRAPVDVTASVYDVADQSTLTSEGEATKGNAPHYPHRR